jgi:predicted DNA-binding protein with PD1-like motif
MRRFWLTALPMVLTTLALTAPAPIGAQDLPPGYAKDPPVAAGLAPNMSVQAASTVARTYQVRFSTGDEILSGLTDLALREGIAAAQITGLGGLSSALLAFGDPSIGERVFKLLPFDDKSELVSLDGTVSLRDGVPSVHLHAVIVFADGTTRGGHVLELNVAPVAEATIIATAMLD